MPNRMKAAVTATLILIGGGLYLSRPPVAEAIPCTVENALTLCNGLGLLLCGSTEASCSFGCAGGEFTSLEITCP